MQHILLVEDEKSIREGLKIWLEKSNYIISEAEDGDVAMDMIKKKEYDLIILDVMLPKKDGYEVLKFVRKNKEIWIPVIMLTAKSQEDEKILGLELGADDYMVKPFSNREIEARINANLRKFVKKHAPSNSQLNFEINENNYTIKNDEIEVDLTIKEMDLLKELIANKNNYISKKDLLERVWEYTEEEIEDTRTVDIHISKVRKKLEKIGVNSTIQTKRGVGYSYQE